MELLNLDDLVTATRQVTLFGETYNLATQSVEQMIAANKMQKIIEQSPDDAEKITKAMMMVAHTILPDCPPEKMARLRFDQIDALISFAAASDEQVVSGATKDDDGFSDEVKKS